MRKTWWSVLALAGCAGCGQEPVIGEPTGPTYYKDVEPIVQTKCAGCHVAGGIGPFVINEQNAGELKDLMVEEVTAKTMPPWPPGPAGQPLVGSRALTDAQIDTIVKWAEAGAPQGDPADHQEREPDVSFQPDGEADLTITMGGANVYVPPAVTNATDEVRCFVLDMPAGTPNAWVRAVEWVTGLPAAIHHIGGVAVDAESAAIAKALYEPDRPGYECAGGVDRGGLVKAVAGFGASGAGKDTGTQFPQGTGVFVPAGSSIVITVHYVIGNVQGEDAGSGVRLWIASDAEKKGLRPMVQVTVNGPGELPCPTGVTTDPLDRCSRDFGMSNVPGLAADETLKTNDFLLASCRQTLDEYYANIDFTQAKEHFYIPSSCEQRVGMDGIIHLVHAHMHTRGASARISAEQADGSLLPLLDIPRWDWTWEAAYLLQQGISVPAGKKLRVDCTFDNGTENQWSLKTGEPGHGPEPAAPPLDEPRYVVAAPVKDADMCGAFVTLERPPYNGGSYPDICHEVQARYDDACAGTLDFTVVPCEGDLERSSVLLTEASNTVFESVACAPAGAGVADGASCADVSTCVITCGATMGLSNGLPAACISACKADATSYGMATEVTPSELGLFHLDRFLECSQAECAAETTWQSYVSCATALCTDLAKYCYTTPS